MAVAPPSSPAPDTAPTTAPLRARATRSRVAGHGWTPGRDDLVDLGFALAAVAVGAFGWTGAFHGTGGVVAALVGGAAAALAAWVSAARRLSPLATLGLALGAFVLASGVAVPDAAIAGFLPGPDVPRALVDGLVDGWSGLVTTAPPAPLSGGLGVVPYTCGFMAAGAAVLVARRTGAALWPALGPLAGLGAAILFGTTEPVNVTVQGGGFVLTVFAWGAVRSNRPRRSLDGEVFWPRIWGGVAMLGIVAVVGLLVGPHLPGVDTPRRKVLREEVVPPHDEPDYVSPLAGLRRYRKAGKDTVYFTVSGLRKGDRIRLATMDSYDGVVWTVGPGDTDGGRFERVGARIPACPFDEPACPAASGAERTVQVTIRAYNGVWIPTLGATRSISLHGAAASEVARTFRFNRATGTAASSVPLATGLSYELSASVPPDPRKASPAALARAGVVGDPIQLDAEVVAALTQIQAVAQKQGGQPQLAPYARARAIERWLHDEGFFTDSPDDATSLNRQFAGHSAARLSAFLTDHPIGNSEQFAAAMALMVGQLGMPSRVVMGFAPNRAGTVDVKGSDAKAWVEVHFADLGWVAFDPTPVQGPRKTQKQETPLPPSNQAIPVPNQINVPETIPEVQKARHRETKSSRVATEASGLPWAVVAAATYVGIPVALVLALAGLVVGLKLRRRRRRRTRGSLVQRINGAWLEAVDRLRDLGHPPPPVSTRREIAGEAAEAGRWPGAREFAARLDGHMFGPDDPGPEAATAVWSDLEQELRAMHAPLTRRKRLRASVSLASLRRRPPRTRPNRGGEGPVAGSVGDDSGARSPRPRGRRRTTPAHTSVPTPAHRDGTAGDGVAPEPAGATAEVRLPADAGGDRTVRRPRT